MKSMRSKVWSRRIGAGAAVGLACWGLVGCGKKPATESGATSPPASATPPAAVQPSDRSQPSQPSQMIGGLFVDDGGSGGVPVVFVHSFAGSSEHWQAQLRHLRATRRAVAFDLPGHGRSAAANDPGSISIPDLANAIGTVVDGLELPRFILVGHSIGGAAAIAYAGEQPDRVAGLVLVGTPGRTSPDQAKGVLTALETNYDKTMQDYWTKLIAGARPKVRAQLEREQKQLSKDFTLALIRATFAYDPAPALAKYKGPKMLFDTPHGDSPNSLAKLDPKLKRRVFKETSHWPQLDTPMRFNRVLEKALREMRIKS